jgi:hypothetical protein
MSRATDIGAQYLGVQESAGPNDGPVLTAIRACLMPPGTGPCSWCALFVAWCLCRAYGPVSQIDYRRWLRSILEFWAAPGESGAPGTWYPESCQSWWEWAMFRRMIVDHPQPGDVVIFLDEHRHAHHMGFVTATHPENEFDTLEGNTNAGGSINGDGVYRRTRTANERTVFVRLPEALGA